MEKGIKISVDAQFKDGTLTVGGYDIGKTVEKLQGDIDYEYDTIIPPESLPKLYKLLDVLPADRKALLNALRNRFGGPGCYLNTRSFLDDHGIEYQTFSWT